MKASRRGWRIDLAAETVGTWLDPRLYRDTMLVNCLPSRAAMHKRLPALAGFALTIYAGLVGIGPASGPMRVRCGSDAPERGLSMLILHCPCCGIDCDETELTPGGEAHIKRHGPGASDDDFHDYLFARKNPKGVHFERWRHAYGCGKWFHAARCTVTLEVFGTYSAQTLAPPKEIAVTINARRPGWPQRHFG